MVIIITNNYNSHLQSLEYDMTLVDNDNHMVIKILMIIQHVKTVLITIIQIMIMIIQIQVIMHPMIVFVQIKNVVYGMQKMIEKRINI